MSKKRKNDRTQDERRAYKASLARKAYRRKRGFPEDADLSIPRVKDAWTADQTAYLKLNWTRQPTAEIADSIGKSAKACQNKAERIGLGCKPRALQTGAGRGTERRMHPLSSLPKPDASEEVRMILEARRKMKERPGAIRLGYRVLSVSYR